MALGIVNNDAQNIAVNLTKKQIEDSPLLKSDEPVSRQFEESYYKYFAVPSYWETHVMRGQYGDMIGTSSDTERLPKSTSWE